MNRIKKYSAWFMGIVMFMALSGFSYGARLKVAAAYPYIRELVIAVGDERVDVSALSRGQWDPHVVVPKPSLISLVRNADLLIINGAQLEIGWIPPLLQQANNPKVQPSRKGFVDLSESFELIQKPESVSRAEGDVHPAGNPHFYLNPHHIPAMVKRIAEKLIELDSAGKVYYSKKLEQFQSEWLGHLSRWEEQMAPLRGRKVIEYHRNLDYFMIQYGVEVVATVELLPGIPPTTKHILGLVELIRDVDVYCIVHDVYHSDKSSRYLSRETGKPVVVLPHDVEAVPQADSLVGLFDTIVGRMVQQ